MLCVRTTAALMAASLIAAAFLPDVAAATTPRNLVRSATPRECYLSEIQEWGAVSGTQEYMDCSALSFPEYFGSCNDPACLALAEAAVPVAPDCVTYDESRTEAEKANAYRDMCVQGRDRFDATTMYYPSKNPTAPICTATQSTQWSYLDGQLEKKFDCSRVLDPCGAKCIAYYRARIQQAPSCRKKRVLSQYTVRELVKAELVQCLKRQGAPLDQDPDLYATSSLRH